MDPVIDYIAETLSAHVDQLNIDEVENVEMLRLVYGLLGNTRIRKLKFNFDSFWLNEEFRFVIFHEINL